MILRDFLALNAQSYAITAAKQLATPVVATGVVIDAIAVANVEAVLGAVPPNCTLHEPLKCGREGRVELASINARRQEPENAGAASRLIASVPVRVVGAETAQDPGSVQEIMDQGVDSNEGRADFEPQRLSVAGAEQQRRQRHGQDLIRHPIDVSDWANDGLAKASEPIRRVGIHRRQLPINPADEVVIGDIPHEQEQAVRHLIQAAVPQRVPRQGAAVEVPGLGTGVGPLLVSAVVKPPVPAELRTRWASRQRFGNVRPAGTAVLGNVL